MRMVKLSNGRMLCLRYLEHGGEQATAVRFGVLTVNQLTRAQKKTDAIAVVLSKAKTDQFTKQNMATCQCSTTTHLLSMKEQPLSGEVRFITNLPSIIKPGITITIDLQLKLV